MTMITTKSSSSSTNKNPCLTSLCFIDIPIFLKSSSAIPSEHDNSFPPVFTGVVHPASKNNDNPDADSSDAPRPDSSAHDPSSSSFSSSNGSHVDDHHNSSSTQMKQSCIRIGFSSTHDDKSSIPIICNDCKMNKKKLNITRFECRVMFQHTALPWKNMFLCITIGESSIDGSVRFAALQPQQGNYIRNKKYNPHDQDDTSRVPMIVGLQEAPGGYLVVPNSKQQHEQQYYEDKAEKEEAMTRLIISPLTQERFITPRSRQLQVLDGTIICAHQCKDPLDLLVVDYEEKSPCTNLLAPSEKTKPNVICGAPPSMTDDASIHDSCDDNLNIISSMCCKICRKKHRTKKYCREVMKHRELPYSTSFHTMFIATTIDETIISTNNMKTTTRHSKGKNSIKAITTSRTDIVDPHVNHQEAVSQRRQMSKSSLCPYSCLVPPAPKNIDDLGLLASISQYHHIMDNTSALQKKEETATRDKKNSSSLDALPSAAVKKTISNSKNRNKRRRTKLTNKKDRRTMIQDAMTTRTANSSKKNVNDDKQNDYKQQYTCCLPIVHDTSTSRQPNQRQQEDENCFRESGRPNFYNTRSSHNCHHDADCDDNCFGTTNNISESRMFLANISAENVLFEVRASRQEQV